MFIACYEFRAGRILASRYFLMAGFCLLTAGLLLNVGLSSSGTQAAGFIIAMLSSPLHWIGERASQTWQEETALLHQLQQLMPEAKLERVKQIVLRLTAKEAQEGVDKAVPLPDGTLFKLKIPPETSNGFVFLLETQTIATLNCYVVAKVVVRHFFE